jgi:hypothetical protein
MKRHKVNSYLLCLFVAFSSFLTVGCEDDEFFFSTFNTWEAVVIKRAEQQAYIKWMPLKNMPRLGDTFYVAGETFRGLPYSSVKELDKFVGLEVSFHTFLSAVNNPRSVLYTENVSKPPYNGSNCGTYYGTVCSAAVNYALGIELPLTTSDYQTCGLFQELKHQELDNIDTGDILLTPKQHVVLVLGVMRNQENSLVEKVKILESSQSGTMIILYYREEIIKRWSESKWLLLRYIGEKKFKHTGFEELQGNMDLCPARGDKSTFREGEDVEISVLNNAYVSASINRGNQIIDEVLDVKTDFTLKDLKYGKYSVQLKNAEICSNPVEFEVLQTNVAIASNGGYLKISFSSENALPEYVVLSTSSGVRVSIDPINDFERSIGEKVIFVPKSSSKLYCKVFFKGDYGRVSNKPIEL